MTTSGIRQAVVCVVKSALIAAALFSASIGFIVLHSHAFGYRRMIIPLHMILIAVLLASFSLLLGLLMRVRAFRSWQGARYGVALLCGFAVSLLWSLYVMDYVGSSAWGHNLTWAIIVTSFTDIPSLVSALPFPAAAVYALVALLLGSIFGFFLLFSKTILAGLEELFAQERPLSLLKTGRRSVMTFGCICVLAGAFGVFMHETLSSPRKFWQGEPLTGLFQMHSVFADTPARRAYADEDRRLRAEYPKVALPSKKNVIVIASDSLRSAHMQVYGYDRPTTPYLAKLDATGRLHKIRTATSVAAESLYGAMGILASRDYMHLSSYNFTLHDLLRHEGYHTYFLLADDNSTWYGYKEMMGRTVDVFFDGTMTKQFAVRDDRLIFEGLDQVPDYDGTPAFFFFFLMSTHFTGVRHEEFDTYQPSKVDSSILEAMWLCVQGDYDQTAMINRYDNGVLQADSFIEKIMAALDAKGYLQDSMTVITADHGEGLGERGHYTHSRYLYQEDVGIPILFYDEPGVVYQNLDYGWQPDIAATILARLGLPKPASWQGRSLLDEQDDRFTFHCTQRNPTSKAVVYETGSNLYKYLVELPPWGKEKTVSAQEFLFELTSDPHEQTSIMNTADPALIATLRKQFDEEFSQ